MKTVAGITLGIVMLSYAQFYHTKYNEATRELNIAKDTINLIQSGTHVEERMVKYKYTSPIDKEHFKKLTSPFGYRLLLNPFTGGTKTSYHKGVDIVGTFHCGITPVTKNGKVIDKWYVPGSYTEGHKVFGGYVRILHSDGWISGYGHLSSIYVKEGDVLVDGIFYRNGKVLPSKGLIGRQGNTGISTGEHLHLSLQNKEGVFVDPLLYLDL